MDRFFDPRQLPDDGRSFDLALDLCTALALLDGDHPAAWRRCRSAAIRYVAAIRAGRFPSGVALDLLRRAVATWAPSELPPERRGWLESRAPFWVGTVYGLRWQAAPDPAAPRPAEPPCEPAPTPGRWDDIHAWRAALDARRRALRARRSALLTSRSEREARAAQLCRAAAERMAECRRLQAETRDQLAAWVATPVPCAAMITRPGPRELSDAAIRAIAVRIRRAVREPQSGDPRDDILSRYHELSAGDEARVEEALRALHDEDAENA